MKGSHLYLEQLKVFVDLVETRSFSKAAARHYLTQSAVSQQVAFLERHFGKKLVERGRGRFALTEEGEIFEKSCRSILEQYQQVLDKLRSKPKELTGTVLIETVYSIGLHTLVPYLHSFMKNHPGVNLRVEYRHFSQIYEDVLKGACHIGLVAFPRQHPALNVTPFVDEKMVMVCAADHALAKKKKIAMKDLQDQRFITFDHNIPTRQAVDRMLSLANVQVKVGQEFDNIETLKKAVEIDGSLTILPEGTAENERRAGALAVVPFSDGPYLRPVAALVRKDATLSRASETFLESLKSRKTKKPDTAEAASGKKEKAEKSDKPVAAA